MSASDTLSTVANSLSVVGLADVVFKYGREAYETLTKIIGAPKQIEQLLDEIKDVEDHIVKVRVFLCDLEQSTLPQASKSVIPAVEALLDRCRKEFDFIQTSAKDSAGSTSDGWFGRFGKSSRWVWKEEEIGLSCRRLARLKAELHSTLTLAGRQHDIAIHKDVTSTRATIVQASSDSKAAFSDLNTATDTIEQKVDSLSTGMHSFIQDNTTQIFSIGAAIKGVQDATEAGTAEIERQLDIVTTESNAHHSTTRQQVSIGTQLIRRDIKATSKSIKQSRKQQSRQQNRIMAKLGKMEDSIATLSLTQTAEDNFIFEGNDLDSATLPLMLLRSELVKALPALESQSKIHLSQSEASWIQQQLEAVLASSHEVSAKVARSRAAGKEPRAIERALRQRNVVASSSASRIMSPKNASYEASRVQPQFSHESGCYKTPFGDVDFTIVRSISEENEPEASTFRSITISFRPAPGFCMSGISTAFNKPHSRGYQSVASVIRVWNIVPESSPAFQAIAANNCSELRRLFETRSASPFDRTPSGRSLVAEAVRNSNYEAFELLLHSGVGPHELELAGNDFAYAAENGCINASRIVNLALSYVPGIWRLMVYCDIVRPLERELNCWFRGEGRA